VLDELVVTEELSIATEKVTEMLSLIETPPWLSVGEIDSTVGDVVSVGVVLSVVVVLLVVVLSVAEYSSFSSLQEMMVRLKQEIRKMNKNFFIFSSIPKVKYYCFLY
jgi:cytochrome c-type biogenesis protein CcmH/NrfG